MTRHERVCYIAPKSVFGKRTILGAGANPRTARSPRPDPWSTPNLFGDHTGKDQKGHVFPFGEDLEQVLEPNQPEQDKNEADDARDRSQDEKGS